MARFIRRTVRSFGLIGQAIRALFVYPKLLTPLFGSWLLLAYLFLTPTVWRWFGEEYAEFRLLFAFGALFALAVLITIASNVALEMIQQIESGATPAVGRALKDALGKNLLRALPVVFVWTVLWYALLLIELLLGEDDRDEIGESTVLDVAGVLDGEIRQLSFSRTYLRAINKVIRMTVFMILPSIAWEDSGTVQAVRRGLEAARSHGAEFAARVVTSELFLTFVVLPLILGYSLLDQFGIKPPVDPFRLGIAYLTLVWTVVFYVEQIFAAELYLWHLRWLAQRKTASFDPVNPDPDLADVVRPSLLDEVPEFASESKLQHRE